MSCPTGKIQYVTVQDAHLALIKIERSMTRSVTARKAGWHKGKSAPYKCHVCNQWHIGHHVSKAPNKMP